ncbi:Endoglucanase GH5 [Mycena sanguinolenta]|uniref:Endoglucanase GH5 n=1 Tax=Mycena sanguinolenta TaxID=230812 RepID=A0A8H7CIG1_9AGAR|nr:Endoglucanase GH5 [Mycena sanguinolenta]
MKWFGFVAGGPAPPKSTGTSSTTTISSTSTVSTVTSPTSSPPSTTTSIPTSTPTSVSQHWGQCGGIGWTGPTVCASPYTCQELNSYYYQCL